MTLDQFFGRAQVGFALVVIAFVLAYYVFEIKGKPSKKRS